MIKSRQRYSDLHKYYAKQRQEKLLEEYFADLKQRQIAARLASWKILFAQAGFDYDVNKAIKELSL